MEEKFLKSGIVVGHCQSPLARKIKYIQCAPQFPILLPVFRADLHFSPREGASDIFPLQKTCVLLQVLDSIKPPDYICTLQEHRLLIVQHERQGGSSSPPSTHLKASLRFPLSMLLLQIPRYRMDHSFSFFYQTQARQGDLSLKASNS